MLVDERILIPRELWVFCLVMNLQCFNIWTRGFTDRAGEFRVACKRQERQMLSSDPVPASPSFQLLSILEILEVLEKGPEDKGHMPAEYKSDPHSGGDSPPFSSPRRSATPAFPPPLLVVAASIFAAISFAVCFFGFAFPVILACTRLHDQVCVKS